MGQTAARTPNIRRFVWADGRPPSSDWVVDISNSLEQGIEFDLGRSWTIYRVPRSMKEVYRKAYVPKLISIGPYHRGDPNLLAMEEHKMRYLLRFVGYESEKYGLQHSQPQSPHPEVIRRLEEVKAAVSALEKRARDCYAEYVGMGSDEFVRMMVVDGCFLIELLRFYYKWDQEMPVDDPIFSTRWMLRTLQRDLLMLENQIPFFVLEELFKMSAATKTNPPAEPSLIDLVITFFDPILPRDRDNMPSLDPTEGFDHMLDVFRSTFLTRIREKVTKSAWNQLRPSNNNNIPLVQERQLIHSAMELQEAGIKLKRKEGDSDQLDITFEGRVLEIPPLYIDGNTLPMFLNFVAYEQCDEDAEPYFTNYFMFFDSLINSQFDVETLHVAGIINHAVGTSKDVANLLNQLCLDIVYDLDECYLSNQMKAINEFCDGYYSHRWRVWWRNLIRERFSSPWTFLSLVAAITLLWLQVGQTLYTIIPYYRPSA